MATNKKQTAVSWLKDQVIDNKDIYIEGNTLMIPNDIFRNAQQMEREQMIEFADDYSYQCTRVDGEDEFWMTLTAEEYYEEKHGTTN